MAEEGSGTNLNIGININNDAVPKSLQGIQRELDQLEKAFARTQATAAKGADETKAKLDNVAQSAAKATQTQAEGGNTAAAALRTVGSGLSELLAGYVSFGAAVSAIWASIREDIKKTDELAKESAAIRNSLGAAGNARPGFSAGLREQLKGTIYADAAGSAMAAQVAAEAPRSMTPAQLGGLMRDSQKYVGLMGSREGAAGLAKDAAVVYDKFGGKITPEQANAYAIALRQAGLQNIAEWNTPVQNLITAGIPAEKAFGIAAGASESDLGTKSIKSLASLIGTENAPAGVPMPKNPSGADQLARMPDRAKRLQFILSNPGLFGFEGDKLRDMMAATNAPTVSGAMAAAPGYAIRDKTQIEAEDLAHETATRQRDIERSWLDAQVQKRMTTYMESNNYKDAYKWLVTRDYTDSRLRVTDPIAAAQAFLPEMFIDDKTVAAVRKNIGPYGVPTGVTGSTLRDIAARDPLGIARDLRTAAGGTETTFQPGADRTTSQTLDINIRTDNSNTVSAHSAHQSLD